LVQKRGYEGLVANHDESKYQDLAAFDVFLTEGDAQIPDEPLLREQARTAIQI